MKNQFWGPSRVLPLWAFFSFLSSFFSPVFFVFFLAFYFFIFSHFLFISSFFWIFYCFSLSFFHFSEEKSFFFSFSFISFKYVLLMAFVSEFNCFLRSRCSMEMWGPDDMERDSWDWVGPPAWASACFNSPEWGGGSSPVKAEPPQIVLLLLLCVGFVVVLCCVVLLCCCVLFPCFLLFDACGQMTESVPDAPPPRRYKQNRGDAESHSPTQSVQKPFSAHGVG